MSNPNIGHFRVVLEGKTDWTQLELLDLTGRVIARQVVRGSGSTELDVRGQAPGVYLLRMEGAGTQAVQRVLIQ